MELVGVENKNLGAWFGLIHRLFLVQMSPCVFVPWGVEAKPEPVVSLEWGRDVD